MSNRVVLREIGLRDGMQLVRTDLPTAHKIEWIEEAVFAGVTEIEVTSFVPAKTFPIFADAAHVAAAAIAMPALTASALAVNLRGAKDAFAAGLKKVGYVVSASEAHSLANVRRTTDEAIGEFKRIVDHRAEIGLTDQISLSCGIATAFGCTLQGDVPRHRVHEIAGKLVELGADEIMVADTVGYANPSQVEDILGECIERFPGVSITGHFHDTRGLGLANVAAAVRVGVRGFDGSLGGLGGCPYAPGATGNVNFEDMAFMLRAMGFETGINLDRLMALRRKIGAWLPEERFTGAILRAGLPSTFPIS